MRRVVLLALLVSLIASCQWSPERDNPYDPKSIGWVAPQPENSPPQIDTFYATTHYWHHELDPVSEYELVCLFSDVDNNIVSDERFPVYSDGEELRGYLISDPNRQVFYYRGYQDDLPPDLTRYNFTVYIMDDSGATASASTYIEQWSVSMIPTLVSPPPQENPITEMEGSLPRVSWDPPTPGYSHFGLTLYLRGVFPIWDTVGISITDTVAFLPTDKVQDAAGNSEFWYAIYLTLYNNEGDSGTGIPGYFRHFYTSGLHSGDLYRREDNDY
ncbi:hypothetical protein KKG66_04615 [bacterium]|nr:hypothetical protein [bacterium]MBU1920107.1 hypothetical protein [bacterium]